ncbi:MAG: type II secretion system protein [Candidatus Blackburnbacteria bacterium]|nr:type II secretion system protein [Candidatus Blackburnbacteria bacterium]
MRRKVPRVSKVSQVPREWERETRDTLSRGFTLIELLVAISIIGILSSLLFVSYTSIQKNTRDTQRKSDLKQYLTALESYASANNSLYPIYGSVIDVNSGLCGELSEFLKNECLQDSRVASGWPNYKYRSDASGIKAGLAARLESGPLSAGMQAKWWVACTNGKMKEIESVSTSPNVGGGAINSECLR